MKKHDANDHEDGTTRDPGPSRRAFMMASVAGMSAAWLETHWTGILVADAYAREAVQAATPPKLEFFSPADAAEIEAMVAQIIPTDDTPGAKEAGTIYFIDHALSTFDKDEQPRYLQGVKDLQAKARELHPGTATFSALSAPQQIEVMKAIEKTPFFATVRQHTIVGFLADPMHGGNRDQIGWKLIGFEGKFNYKAPYGYYDRDYKPAQ